MLIQALCDYYDILVERGNVLSDDYCFQKIDYMISLTEEGKIDGIVAYDDTGQAMVLPKRVEKSSICANIIEHRPLYLFGLNDDKEGLTPKDKTNKAQKSHTDFVEKNLAFVEGIHSPIVDAYRQFMLNWQPEKEVNNPYLCELGKKYQSASYAFFLSGHPEIVLHEDEQIKTQWEKIFLEEQERLKSPVITQCAIDGKQQPIARVHNKIKGVLGGQTSGCVLVGCNNQSEESYGYEQSYNSNISEASMRKYTKTLNYLLSCQNHKQYYDELTMVYWTMSRESRYDDLMTMLLFDQETTMNQEETEMMLIRMVQDSRKGMLTPQRVAAVTAIDPNIDFYMLGLKPNASRLSLKFIEHCKLADVLMHVAQHQSDLQVSGDIQPVALWQLKKELVPPKSNQAKINPALWTKIIGAMLNETEYPQAMLYEAVRRFKTDGEQTRNQQRIRMGMIKAYLNRRARRLNQKEEINVSLDKENNNPAYLCGRLFAVLEKLQQEASGNRLNRTIKDAYFSAASARPAAVFPKLIRLAQNHLKKVDYVTYYNKQIGAIMDRLGSAFPDTLLLMDQGKFMLGYYQQYQSFFEQRNQEEEGKND